MADDAVICEPLSMHNRVNYREIADFQLAFMARGARKPGLESNLLI